MHIFPEDVCLISSSIITSFGIIKKTACWWISILTYDQCCLIWGGLKWLLVIRSILFKISFVWEFYFLTSIFIFNSEIKIKQVNKVATNNNRDWRHDCIYFIDFIVWCVSVSCNGQCKYAGIHCWLFCPLVCILEKINFCNVQKFMYLYEYLCECVGIN